MIDQIQKVRRHIEIAVSQAGQMYNLPAFLVATALEGVLNDIRAISINEMMDFYEDKLKQKDKEEDHGTEGEHRDAEETD